LECFDKITKSWSKKKKKVQKFFKQAGDFEDKNFWIKCLKSIEEQLKVREQSKYFQILIAYTMLMKEVDELKKKFADRSHEILSIYSESENSSK
jgi:hypothetical protein